jgi:hypothetical protein
MQRVTLTCRRCGAHVEAQREADGTVVPAGWRRVLILTAGPGTRVTEDLGVYEVTDGMWLCPAKGAETGLGRAMNRRGQCSA